MTLSAPLCRQRLYTTWRIYLSLCTDLLSGRVHGGQELAALERRFAGQFGAAHALTVNQARVGIYLAVRALLKRSRGNKVIMSPYTIFDVVNMVISAGGEPVFADVDRATCNIDPGDVEQLITEDTALVLVTHLHGLSCDMHRVLEICRSRGVPVMEDTAQAAGCRIDGRHAGTLGNVGVFSFGLMKNITSFYGGMVVTDDESLYRDMAQEAAEFDPVPAGRLAKRAIYGLALETASSPLVFRAFTFWLFRHAHLRNVDSLNKLSRAEDNPVLRSEFPAAYRQRPGDAQARLVTVQLAGIDALSRQRLALARLYHDRLKDIPEILLPPFRDDGSQIYLVYPIQVSDRRGLIDHLMRSRRDCGAQHLKNCADLPCFSAYARTCLNARQVAERTLLLPTYPGYGEAEAERTAQAVRGFFAR